MISLFFGSFELEKSSEIDICTTSSNTRQLPSDTMFPVCHVHVRDMNLVRSRVEARMNLDSGTLWPEVWVWNNPVNSSLYPTNGPRLEHLRFVLFNVRVWRRERMSRCYLHIIITKFAPSDDLAVKLTLSWAWWSLVKNTMILLLGEYRTTFSQSLKSKKSVSTSLAGAP